MRARSVSSAFLLLVIGGCGGDAGGADPSPDGGDGGDSAGGDLDDTRVAYCNGSGPPILVGDGTTVVEGQCTGEIAEAAFTHALCTCAQASLQDILTVDAFDSRLGPYQPPGLPGGSVGINTTYESTNVVNIGGSLTIGATSNAVMSDTHQIGDDLRVNATLVVDATVRVGRDAYINGNVSGSDPLLIAGRLFQPPGASTQSAVNASGGEFEQAIAIPAPCACGDDQLVDIAGIVAAGKLNNHNAEIGLDPAIFNGPQQAVDISLPCGRLFVERINAGAAPITIRVEGRTLLYVETDILVENTLQVIVGPDAELDLFVGGNIEATATLNLGQRETPSMFRTYVGGTRPIVLSSGSVFAGNIYAPFAQVQPADAVTVYGAVFARSFATSGNVTIHYDRAINDAGAECPLL